MKILIISGTNRINGNTNKILSLVSERLANENHQLEFETVHLGKSIGL